jgi:hypothetical protein
MQSIAHADALWRRAERSFRGEDTDMMRRTRLALDGKSLFCGASIDCVELVTAGNSEGRAASVARHRTSASVKLTLLGISQT